MRNLFVSLGLGLAAAAIDVVPMIARKLDSAFSASAFFMWLVLGLIIPNTRLIPIAWLNGLVVALLCALPVVILVTKLDRLAIPVMLASSAILGALIGFFSSVLIK